NSGERDTCLEIFEDLTHQFGLYSINDVVTYGSSGSGRNPELATGNRQVYLSPDVQSQRPGKKQKKALAISLCLVFRSSSSPPIES
ncbi:MAG: hypothetical protein EZS28_032410, partial [Streblomastix strix]